jgi:hypothetical protein
VLVDRLQRIAAVQVPLLTGVSKPLLVPEAAATLPKIVEAVRARGGTFGTTSAFRSWRDQYELRAKWERWNSYQQDLKAGANRTDSPPPPKQAYAASPGGSWHEAGRALDFAVRTYDLKAGRYVSLLKFKGVDDDRCLQVLWDIVKPLGWSTIIGLPSINLDECWHFEFHGVWAPVVAALGYRDAVRAAILDVGNWGDPGKDMQGEEAMFIQAQLLRLGHHEIGKVDGAIGPKTLTALKAVGSPSEAAAAVEFLKTK